MGFPMTEMNVRRIVTRISQASLTGMSVALLSFCIYIGLVYDQAKQSELNMRLRLVEKLQQMALMRAQHLDAGVILYHVIRAGIGFISKYMITEAFATDWMMSKIGNEYMFSHIEAHSSHLGLTLAEAKELQEKREKNLNAVNVLAGGVDVVGTPWYQRFMSNLPRPIR